MLTETLSNFRYHKYVQMNRIFNPQNYAGLKNESKHNQQQQLNLLNSSTTDAIVIQNNEIHYRNDLCRMSTAQEDIPIPTVKPESIAVYEKYCQMRQSIMEQKSVDPVISQYVNALG